MRIPASVVAAAILATLLAAPAAAQPLLCVSGGMQSAGVSPDATLLRVRAKTSLPAGFDPVANGLVVALTYEPETDSANDFYSVTLPAGGPWQLTRTGGFLYKDLAAAVGGIKRVEFRLGTRDGLWRVRIDRKGTPIASVRAGNLRLLLRSGAGCARTCGSPCTLRGTRLLCRRSIDTALCGIMSGCELLNVTEGQTQPGHCMLPYPSDFFQVADPSTPTGKRHAYRRRAMITNAAGVRTDPTHWNKLDGFSPGTIATSYFPQGVDLAASGIPPLTNFAASVDPGSPTLLIEADSPGCVRVEHFGENDVSHDSAGMPIAPPRQVFMIRPGRRLNNATRYIVALRNLVGQDAQPIAAGSGFAALRDGTPAGNAALEARRPAIDAILNKLTTDCGVTRSSVVLAWDFTTASDDNLQRWLLHMRDEAFAALGPGNAPAFSVTSSVDDPVGDPRICRRVVGTYTVPLYTTFNGPGSVLNLDPVTDLPVQNGVATNIPFTAIIPCSLVNPTPSAGRPIFFGHGLLGTGAGAMNSQQLWTLANTYGFVIAATDWQGMAAADLGVIAGFLSTFNDFRILPERLHQGILNMLLLGRLMTGTNGFASHAAFQFDDGFGGMVPVIDTSEAFYYGISQGGIFGGTVMALAQETTRGILGVPAANFSTLLHRSVDFDTVYPFFTILRGSWPDHIQRAMIFPIIEELWQRAEPLGWYHRTLSNPLPATPAHKVLVHMATNDAEVANIATEIMVRSMGMPQVAPVVQSYYGIPEQLAPFDSAALIESDGHYPPVPLTNTAPPDNAAHGAMRALPAIQAQIDQFLRTGGDVQNFCVGPCDPE